MIKCNKFKATLKNIPGYTTCYVISSTNMSQNQNINKCAPNDQIILEEEPRPCTVKVD